ncbi:peroxisomal succinyl-coenzyme A thioesterase-like [Montipora foliosa]|uniref:peroxisomal succinyl-coenzyme A thioesterase-like n=1 Tax=Montipora foliosa TaxID=591990 RepID=UPI0035F1B4E5
MAALAKIEVKPSLETTVDQKIEIIVRNLCHNQSIILRARTIDDSNILFESFAKYKANENGVVFVPCDPSLGGSYIGVEPMGLFWSMKPVTDGDRDDLLRKRNVTTPLKVTVDVYSGDDERALDKPKNKIAESVTLLRSYMGKGVSRRFLENDGFYGTLFLPPGDGPFHGVVDMWGRTGGLREDRAALLASSGFATLVLAYCEFRDLPQKYDVLDLSYFEMAIDWLSAHPRINSDGVSLVGLSFGGVVAMAIASQLSQKIKGVISISGPHALIGCSFKCKTFTIPGYPIETMAADYTSYQKFLSIFKRKEACKTGSPSLVPVENITCPVLFVYGLADQLNPEIEWMCREIFQRMDQHGKGSLFKSLPLVGAGHFITPCYLPPCSKQYVKIYNDVWILGGENTALQAKASELYWNESLKFLAKNIS